MSFELRARSPPRFDNHRSWAAAGEEEALTEQQADVSSSVSSLQRAALWQLAAVPQPTLHAPACSPHRATHACLTGPMTPQDMRAFEVEGAPLLPTVSAGARGGLQRGGGGGGGHDTEPPVDWIMTSLLFLFPAIGGALFG